MSNSNKRNGNRLSDLHDNLKSKRSPETQQQPARNRSLSGSGSLFDLANKIPGSQNGGAPQESPSRSLAFDGGEAINWSGDRHATEVRGMDFDGDGRSASFDADESIVVESAHSGRADTYAEASSQSNGREGVPFEAAAFEADGDDDDTGSAAPREREEDSSSTAGEGKEQGKEITEAMAVLSEEVRKLRDRQESNSEGDRAEALGAIGNILKSLVSQKNARDSSPENAEELSAQLGQLQEEVRAMEREQNEQKMQQSSAQLGQLQEEMRAMERERHEREMQRSSAASAALEAQIQTVRDELQKMRDRQASAFEAQSQADMAEQFAAFDRQMQDPHSSHSDSHSDSHSNSHSNSHGGGRAIADESPPGASALSADADLSQQFAAFDLMLELDEERNKTSEAMAAGDGMAIALAADNPGKSAIEDIAAAASIKTGLRIQTASANDSAVGWLGLNVHPAQELETIHQKVLRREGSKFLPASDERQNAEYMALQQFFGFQAAEPMLLDSSAVTRFNVAKSQLQDATKSLTDISPAEADAAYRSKMSKELKRILEELNEVGLFFEEFLRFDFLDTGFNLEDFRGVLERIRGLQRPYSERNFDANPLELDALRALGRDMAGVRGALEGVVPELSEGYDRSPEARFALAGSQLKALRQELKNSWLVRDNAAPGTEYFLIAQRRALSIAAGLQSVLLSFENAGTGLIRAGLILDGRYILDAERTFNVAQVPILNTARGALATQRDAIANINADNAANAEDRFVLLKRACKRMAESVEQELAPAVEGLAKISTIFTVEPFYLFRLMVPFQVVAREGVTQGLKRKASGEVTKLVNNHNLMGWVSDWLEKKMIELDAVFGQLDDRTVQNPPKDLFFHLKGGRAQAYLLNDNRGENDWDTGIVINPDLPAERWHAIFNQVHNVVLNKLRKFKQEFFILMHVHQNAIVHPETGIKALAQPPAGEAPPADGGDGAEGDGWGPLGHLPEDPLQRMELDLLHDPARDPRDEVGGCKAELIDIGIPRRDAVESAEHWHHTRPHLARANDVPIPGYLYFVDEYLTMIREALADESPAPHKASKRIRRLFAIMNFADPNFDRIAENIREDLERERLLTQALAIIATLIDPERRTPTKQYVRRSIAILCEQFVKAYDLKAERGLASVFELKFLETYRGIGELLIPAKVQQGIRDDDLWNDPPGRGAQNEELLRWAMLAAKLSTTFEQHFKQRAEFFGFARQTNDPQKTRQRNLTEFIKTLFARVNVSSPDSNEWEAQLAVCGSLAAYLHAAYAKLLPGLKEKLDPVFRIELKLFSKKTFQFTRRGDTPFEQRKQEAIEHVRLVVAALVREGAEAGAENPYPFTVEVTPGEEIRIIWSDDVGIGTLRPGYKPLVIVIRIEPLLWPQISFVKGFPVLSLRDLIREYDRKAALAGEWGRIRVLKNTSGILREILTQFDY